MRKFGGELAILVALVALGVAAAVGGVGYEVFGKGGRIAPGFMPTVGGLALAGFGTWAAVEAVLKRRREPATTPPSTAETDAEGQQDRPRNERRVALVFGMTVAAAALTVVTGFLLAFGLLVLSLLWFVEKERPWLAIVVSVVAVVLCWLLFAQLFQVPLPDGLIGFLGRV